VFDPGLSELILIAIIALVVLGPERLPVVARKLGRFIGGLQKMFIGFQHEVQRHIDSVEQPLHETKEHVETQIDSFKKNLNKATEDLESVLTSDSRQEE